MARRRRKHSKKMFHGLGNMFKGNVEALDVVIGGAAAMGGIALAKYALNRFYPTANDKVKQAVPFLGAAVVGALAYFALPKIPGLNKYAGKKQGLTLGAVAAAIPLVGYPMLSAMKPEMFPPLSGMILEANSMNDYSGMLYESPQLNGVLYEAPQLNGYADVGHMAELAELAMMEEEDLLEG